MDVLFCLDTLSPGTDASIKHSSNSLDTARLSTSLLYAVQQALSTVSCAFVQAAVSNIREMADSHRKEINALMEAIHRTASRNATSTTDTSTDTNYSQNTSNSVSNMVDYSAYNAFLQALEDGAKDIEITFEGVAEYLETTNIGLHLSLKRMKEKVQNDKLAGTPPNTTANNTTENNTVPDLTYSKESHSVTSNSVNFYEEACVDLTNWLITIALQYAALPSAAQLVSQRLASLPMYRPAQSAKDDTHSGNMLGKVNMEGVLFLQPQAEDRAVQAVDSNVHAR